MKDLNTFSISGRLTADVTVNTVGSNNVDTANFTLAVNKEGKDAGSAFIPFTAWRQTAKYLGQYAKKGTALIVKGRIDMSSKYEDKDGVKHYPHPQLIVEDVKILAVAGGGKKAETGETESVNLDSSTDLPY